MGFASMIGKVLEDLPEDEKVMHPVPESQRGIPLSDVQLARRLMEQRARANDLVITKSEMENGKVYG